MLTDYKTYKNKTQNKAVASDLDRCKLEGTVSYKSITVPAAWLPVPPETAAPKPSQLPPASGCSAGGGAAAHRSWL